jgi:hypothetical protein
MSLYLKKSCLAIMLSIVTCSLLQAVPEESEWTLLVYAQAKNSLSNFAPRNFSDMAAIGPNKNLKILIQWYKYGHQGSWRYRVEKGKIDLEGYIPATTDGTKAEDLVGAVKWAHNRCPSKKFGLILWNHGIGIIDPIWGQSMLMINSAVAKNNPKIQIGGVTSIDHLASELYTKDPAFNEQVELAKNDTYLDMFAPHKPMHRGILFNEQTRTYMNNQVLCQALTDIKNKVLHKKIDLLGMDACLMAMIEVGYQIKESAQFMVASQEVELAYGWNYKSLLNALSKSKVSALDAAKSIVLGYEAYYRNKIHFYTQSAIDLQKIDYLRQAIDNVIDHVSVCDAILKSNLPNIYKIIKKVRSNCIQLSTPSYVDLNSFMVEFERQLQVAYKRKLTSKSPLQLKAINDLNKSIDLCKRILSNVVVANACGKYLCNVKGLSIYFPNTSIDHSYPKTLFAKNSSWMKFLQRLLYKR